MSNQQIGYVVGGVIGYFTGGLSYVALGATAGGIVGGLLTPKQKTEGPKLDDLKVTVSTYGSGIPTLYGNFGIGGNVVWSTNKIEIPSTTSSGKGGGTETTNYDYIVHMRIVLCETPRDGSTVSIRKIWADGKLIYDASMGISIGSAIASAESPYANITLFQGDDAQLPWTIEELYEGSGNTPAYRDVVSIGMFAVPCPGGRIPQYSFECCVDANTDVAGEELADFAHVDRSTISGIAYADGSVWNISYYANSGVVNIYSEYGSTGSTQVIGHKALSSIVAYPVGAVGQAEPITLYVDGAGGGVVTTMDLRDMTGEVIFSDAFLPGATTSSISFTRVAYDPIDEKYAMAFLESGAERPPFVINAGVAVPMTAVTGDTGGIAMYDGILYVVKTSGGVWSIARRDAETGAVVGSEVAGPTAGGSVKRAATYLDPATGDLFVTITPTGTAMDVYSIDLTSMVWTLIESGLPIDVGTTDFQKAFFVNDDIVISGPKSGDIYEIARLNIIDPNVTLVADIIEDQCIRAGMSAGQVDVTGIIDEVWGYVIANPASARTNIQPLLTAYAIDATEENGKVRFFKRANLSSVASITYAELGCVEGSAEPGDPMPMTFQQEPELYRSVTVSVVNPNFDYQTSSEPAQRQVTTAQNDSVVDLPIGTSATHAATIAQWVLYDNWNERERRSFKVSRKYAFVSAGDAVTMEYPEGTTGLWRWVKVTDTGAVIEGECVPYGTSLWDLTAPGATSYTGQEVAPIAPQARELLLDIPILRDEDNNAGLYVALDGYSDGFRGAELFSGADSTSLESDGSVSTAAPIGIAETALGSATSGYLDETNLVTVDIGDDTFTSVTRDVLLANGGELWALGAPGRWEIGMSALGSSLGSGRYILSRHLRGMFGTERHAATHVVGDTFILLREAGLLRPDMTTTDLGQEFIYRAVGKGRNADTSISQSFTNTGEGLKPLSPINLRRTDTNDLTVDRRSRFAMNNSTGSVPLGEATEAYSWSFYTSGAFTTLIGSVTTTTATVTAAQMTSIGVTPSGALYVRVCQLSDAVGAGNELQATA